MTKKILILENSTTVQKLFTKTLDSSKYTIKFVRDAKDVFSNLFDFQPELLLINCDIQEPRSYEIVKVLRTIECFKGLSIGMYANLTNAMDEASALESGANSFIRLSSDTLEQNVDELAEIETTKLSGTKISQFKKECNDAFLFLNTAEILSKTSFKNQIYSKLINLIDLIDNLEEMIKNYLLLVAEICEVPMAAMYIMENEGPQGYYVCASNMDVKAITDFISVCASDFEKQNNNFSVSKIQPKKLESNDTLDQFYSSQVQLSSYETRVLKNSLSSSENIFGTVHIVSEGNIISTKLEYLDFCVAHAGEVFEKAIIVQKKMFFEKRIRRAFSRFVPEQIIDSLVMQSDATDEKIGVGETRAVAILFSDIRSFTNISEKNRADVLVAFLNRYFSTMVEIIKKHGGTIDKFIGDAIMAEFGTPVSYDDNCRRAVMAAYEMRDALDTIELGDLVMPEGMKFNIGIGIHYGDVIVGSIGSKDKTDYSVIGDNVNLASRLEGLTKTYGTQILVSESVRNDAGEDSFAFRHLDDVRVKGKKNAVPIYAVDRSADEFPAEYKDAYIKGMELYKQGIWNLATDYFYEALKAVKGDKAAQLMLDRCNEFIKNPPENWDGAIAFMTK